MYPAVRPGDVLRIRSCKIEDVAVGDIAVCRRPGCLTGHRVIRTGRSESGVFITTRPDRTLSGDDGPTFAADLLGVVAAITRDGVEVPLQPAAYGRLAKQWYRARLRLIEIVPAVRELGGSVAGRTQETGVFRLLAGAWLARSAREMRFLVHVPLNATIGDALFREVESIDFDPEGSWNGRSIDRFKLVAIPRGGKTPAGSIEATREPGAGWQVHSPLVRRRYKGAGLDHLLEDRVRLIFERERAAAHSQSRPPASA